MVMALTGLPGVVDGKDTIASWLAQGIQAVVFLTSSEGEGQVA